MKRSINKSALCLSILSMVLGNSAQAGQQGYQTYNKSISSSAAAKVAAPKQDIQIYFGTMTAEDSSGRDTSEVSNIQLNIERIDYKTSKGTHSASCGKSVHFNKDQQDDEGTALNDVEGLSQINIVLNKNKCGAIRDHRGHQCVIKDQNVAVSFDKNLNFSNYENSKLKLFLDIRHSSFEYKKDGSCLFIPKFQVVHSGHNRSCVIKRGCGKGSYKAASNFGRFVSSLRSASSNKHHSCKRSWDRDETDAIYDKECQQHGNIPTHTGCGGHNTPSNPGTPTPVPTPVPSPAPSPSPVPTPAPSPAPSPSPVPTPVPSPVPSPSPIPTPAPSPVPSPTPAPVEPTPVDPSNPTGPSNPTAPVEPSTPPSVPTTPTEPSVPPVVPTTPVEPTAPAPVPGPVISNFKVLENFFSAVSVSWTTDVVSTTQVIVTNMTTGVQTVTAVDATATTSHYMVINGLDVGTSYQLQAVSATGSASTTSAAIFGSTVGQ